MSNPVIESTGFTNITSTTTIRTGKGQLLGIFCASSTGGTVKITDGALTVVNTFSPNPSSFHPIPANFNTSLVITITGTTDITVFWNSIGP